MPRGKSNGRLICRKANGMRATTQNKKKFLTNVKLTARELCLLSSTTALREDYQKDVVQKSLNVKITEVDLD